MGKVIMQTLQASDQQKTYSDKANYNFHLLADYINGVKTIKGDKGDQGLPGSTGRQGIQGDRGNSIFVYDGNYPVVGSTTYEKDLKAYQKWVEENGVKEGDVVWFSKTNTLYTIGEDTTEVPTEQIVDINNKIDATVNERDRGIQLWGHLSDTSNYVSLKQYIDESEKRDFGGIILNSSIYDNIDKYVNEQPKAYLSIFAERGLDMDESAVQLYDYSKDSTYPKGIILGASYAGGDIEDLNRSLVVSYNPYREDEKTKENDFYETTFVMAGDSAYNEKTGNCFSSGYRFVTAHGNIDKKNVDFNNIITFGDGRFVNAVAYTDGHEETEASDFDKTIYNSITFTRGTAMSGDSMYGGRFLIGTRYDANNNVLPIIDIYNTKDNYSSQLDINNGKLSNGIRFISEDGVSTIQNYGGKKEVVSIGGPVSQEAYVSEDFNILSGGVLSIKAGKKYELSNSYGFRSKIIISTDEKTQGENLISLNSYQGEIELKNNKSYFKIDNLGNTNIKSTDIIINNGIKDKNVKLSTKTYTPVLYVSKTESAFADYYLMDHSYQEFIVYNSKHKNVLTVMKSHYNENVSERYDGACFLKFTMPTVSATKEGESTPSDNVGGWQGGFTSYIMDGQPKYEKGLQSFYSTYGLKLSAAGELTISANGGVKIDSKLTLNGNSSIANEYTTFNELCDINPSGATPAKQYCYFGGKTKPDERNSDGVVFKNMFENAVALDKERSAVYYRDPYIYINNKRLVFSWNWETGGNEDLYMFYVKSQKNSKNKYLSSYHYVQYTLKKKIDASNVEIVVPRKIKTRENGIEFGNDGGFGINLYIGKGTYTLKNTKVTNNEYQVIVEFVCNGCIKSNLNVKLAAALQYVYIDLEMLKCNYANKNVTDSIITQYSFFD